ncbi:hypothetical protein ABL78_0684 [Leptomonas seymouri]|uniref:Uncharacterized protein n=1 Tax=Leptomonas seymouri TaxID=5684 RepID=A0A0N0P8N8_LEPSE|nr:hypothetical protein ABL78_0684 [Leptomonas seymouri]|eukprot:KPI90166.1 hypothetical protein ABL78_0684 [Leptomonas seymouri]
MKKIEVPCAYRCEETTVTSGDIRTLPKNHYITNACVQLRHHVVRRAQLLEKKLALLGGEIIIEGCGRHVSSRFAAADVAGQMQSVATRVHPASQIMLKKEKDLVAELYECEWCSCSSVSCEVCPYCWSRICAECRGQFSDHQFLCVVPNQPGHLPPEGWLPGTTPSGVSALSSMTVDNDASMEHQYTSTGTPEANGGQPTPFAASRGDSYPFFFTPFFVPTLVKECLVKQHKAPLQLSEIDIRNIKPVRLRVPEFSVKCQHHTTGFSFDYTVYPAFSTREGVMIDLNTPHWTDCDGKPSSTLSFLASATRLGETVLQDLHQLSTATSDVVLELSSAAHQAYVRCNKGFHMYALHVWALVRAQCQLARDALLPHLERSRLLESIMGDLVTYRFQQTIACVSPSHKHVVRGRCVAFLKTEIQMCRQLDQVMESINAVCRGIHTLLGCMRDALKELAQPTVHRSEEHKKSRKSRLRFSTQLFRSCQAEDSPARPAPQQQGKEGEHLQGVPGTKSRAGALCSGETRRSTSRTTPSGGASVDPLLGDATASDSSFRGQVREHFGSMQVLTDSLVSIVRCCMQARVWEWSLGNTCIRECGLGEEDRRVLLQTEETLQLLTDDLMRGIWLCGRHIGILEVQQDAAGPASSLDVLTDAETLALLDLGMENHTYELVQTSENLRELSQLRASLLSAASAENSAVRNPEIQQELLNMMTSVLRALMGHQLTELRTVVASENAYTQRLADYLRTRNIVPADDRTPPINEHTLFAVDMLKVLQQRRDVPAASSSTEAAPSFFADWVDGGGDGKRGHTVSASLPSSAAPGQKDPKELLFSPTSTSSCEARTAAHALHTDFLRRDTALLSCQRYGEALVRAANGVPLDGGAMRFDLYRKGSDGAPPTGLHQLPPLPAIASGAAVSTRLPEERLIPPPSLLAVEESESNSIPTSSMAVHAPEIPEGTAGEGGASRTQVDTLGALTEDSTYHEDAERQTRPAPAESDNSLPPLLNVSPTASLYTVGRNTAAAGGAASTLTPCPNPCQDELLFESDCTKLPVETAHVELSRTDANGSGKAAKLFKTTFQLPTTTASAEQRRITYLPFYRGECTYKGVSTTFYVDAQTGMVSINPQLLCTGGHGVYVLTVLSSPVFMACLSITLSVLLRNRYKLEITYS